MGRDLTIERTFRHPPERVWRALTNPAALAAWNMENDFQPRLGHCFQFRMPPQPGFDGVIHCEVTELEAPRRLAYTWRSNAHPSPTTVTWTLTPVAEGTHLRLDHRGFEGLFGVALSFMLGSGWGRMLRTRLAAVLDRIDEPEVTPAALKEYVEACEHDGGNPGATFVVSTWSRLRALRSARPAA